MGKLFIRQETWGVIESILASMIIFSPNFLLLFDLYSGLTGIMKLYDFVLIFLLVSKQMHISFSQAEN